MEIKKEFIHPNSFTRPGIPLRRVTAIAIHYTGDPGATAQNERDYFNGPCVAAKRYASCHFCVGIDGEVIQLIPESEWAYCTNQANSHTLSIETCHKDSTGKFTDASEKSLIELTSSLCRKYGLNPLRGGVIRHYDVTGKVCPKYYVDHPSLWEEFKQSVFDCMTGKSYRLPCSGNTIEAHVSVNPDYCDTTSVSACKGMVYTFKTGSEISCANDSFKKVSTARDDGYFLTTFKAVSYTDGVGFYAHGKRRCVGAVFPPYCDTRDEFSKRIGKTYEFKSDFPIVCGNSDVFEEKSKVHKGRYYFTKFEAVGHGSTGFYCGNTRMCVGTVI